MSGPLIWEQTHNIVFIKANDEFKEFIINNESFNVELQFHTTNSTNKYVIRSDNLIEGHTFYEKPMNLDVNFEFTPDQALLYKLSF